MRFRPATAGDLALVRDIVRRAYVGYVERIGARPGPMDDDYDGRVERGELFVVDDDGRVLGLIVLVECEDHLYVANVAVDPDRQGTGLGRLLLEEAESLARSSGLGEIRLHTNIAMTENQALYPHLGFRETARGDHGGFQRVWFSKRLD